MQPEDHNELPTGTITYLFTDVEGSTRLWETQPEEMRLALRRHDELVAEHVVAGGGRLIRSRGEGDSHFAVFDAAVNGVLVAGQLQRALLTEQWPVRTPFRVRFALHTGVAEARDGTYYGSAVNRCARLRAIAYGGQIVLSGATAGLTPDILPQDFALRDLGEHRLRDLERPERVFQLIHPDLPDTFPPLNSLDSPTLPNNLPRQLTSFIGRQAEMEELRRLIGTTPLLTLLGAGGCGKTRLALQAAAELLDDYPDGVWFMDFAPLSDGGLVVQTVAGVLQTRVKPGQTTTDAVLENLRRRRTLLILDNCEHVLAEVSTLVERILEECPGTRILATSREALGVYGESEWRVPSLLQPEPGELLLDKRDKEAEVVRLLRYDSVRLFVDRVAAHRPGFTLDSRNAPAVARLCHRLDGIPLALELAAVRVRAMPIEQVAARLDDCFQILTGGSRNALPRQQTLKALIDWSYDLLSSAEQRALCRLSIFRGGWTLEAAEAVCADSDLSAVDVLDLLTGLVNKSLVLFEERDGYGRYRLLETVRQYGRFRLVETSDETDRVAARHLAFFTHWAGDTVAQLNGPEQRVALQQLDAERDNLWVALDWAASFGESLYGEQALLLAGRLARYWLRRGFYSEGRDRLQRLQEQFCGDEPTPGCVEAMNGEAIIARSLGRLQDAEDLLRRCVTVCESLGDEASRARALGTLGLVLAERGSLKRARPLLVESLSIRRRLQDDPGVADAENNLGNLAWYAGDVTGAESHYRRCLTIRERMGDEEGIATTLNNLGLLAKRRNDLTAAESLFERSRGHFESLGNKGHVANLLLSLGRLSQRRDNIATARKRLEDSLRMFRELGEEQGISDGLTALAQLGIKEQDSATTVACLQENLPRCLQREDWHGLSENLITLVRDAVQGGYVEPGHGTLLAAAYRLRNAFDWAPDPETQQDDPAEMLIIAVGPDKYESAFEAGQELTAEDTVALALSLLAER